MALVSTTVIANYMKTIGITSAGNIRDMSLVEQLTAMWAPLWNLHVSIWDWPFMEKAEYELTVFSGTTFPITVSSIFVVKSARVTSTLTTGEIANALTPVPKGVYDILMSKDSTTTSKNPSRVAYWASALYPYPPPATGTEITITGLTAPQTDGNYSSAIDVPHYHEIAFYKLFDWQLKRGGWDEYKELVTILGGKQIRDMWNNPMSAGIAKELAR